MVQIPVDSRHSPQTFLFNLAPHADPCQLFQAVCSHLSWIPAICHFWCKFSHRVQNFIFFVYAGVDLPPRGASSCGATGNSTCPGNYLNLSAFVQWLSSELSQQKPGATMNVFLWLRWRRIADTPPLLPPTHTQKTRQLHAALLHVAHLTVKQYCHCFCGVPMAVSCLRAAVLGLWSWGPVRSFPIVGTMGRCEWAHSGGDVRSARYDSTLRPCQGGFPALASLKLP